MKRVTAIGEILYDVYPDIKRLGGAPFNFIYHVWKILGKANFISSVGNDANGREIINHLSSVGFDAGLINIDEQHATGTVKVTLDENKMPCFVISPESSYDFIELNDKTRTVVERETDLLYFGTLTTRNNVSRQTVLSLLGNKAPSVKRTADKSISPNGGEKVLPFGEDIGGANKNLKFFCDLNLRHNFFSKELIETMLHASHIIKLNDTELFRLRQFFGLDESAPKAVLQLINNFNIEIVALTLGEDGAEIYTANKISKYKVEQKKVVDTLGAGDAYASIFCLGYLYGLPADKINQLANEFASEICLIKGAIPVDDSAYARYREIFSATN